MRKILAALSLGTLLAWAPGAFAQTAGETESVPGNPAPAGQGAAPAANGVPEGGRDGGPAGQGAAEGEPSAELDDFAEFGDKKDPPIKRVFDPLSGYNRVVFKFNDKFYFWVAKPLAKGYGLLVPQVARVSVSKAFSNLRFPLRFVNCLLQLKMKKAGVELGRFVVNSSAGIGGLFDPAGRYFHWRSSEEDFGQTLGHYGIGDGFPLVLPVLGQTNLRDGVGLVPNFLVSPISYVADFETSFAVSAGEQFNFVSLHLGEYESIKGDALDPYTFIRDAYKQNRDKKIRE